MSETDFAEKRATILEEKRNVTGRISETCRIIGFGLLAIFYTLKIGDSAFPASIREHHSWVLFIVGLSGALAIVFDYFQYLFGVCSVEEALKRESLDYDDESFCYRGRAWAYHIKQVAVGVGALAVVILILIA